MNTNQLLTMLTLLREQSYQKTAMTLHYSRSTAMDHIKALEQELGVKLFQKRGRDVIPTDAGLRFSVHAQAMLDRYDQALREIHEASSGGGLRILTIETLGLYLLRSSFNHVMLQHPDLELSIKFGTHNTFCEKLKAVEADIAFGFIGRSWGRIPDSDFSVTPICREPIVFFASADSALAQKETFCLSDLQDVPLWMANKDGIYTERLQRLCRGSGLNIQPQKYVDSGTLLKQLVSDNNCVSIISKIAIASELKEGSLVELPWEGEPLYGDVIAVTRKENHSNLCDEFIRTVQNSRKPACVFHMADM